MKWNKAEKVNAMIITGIFFVMLSISLISAPKPTTPIVSNYGLEISYPNSYYLAKNISLSVRFWVYNITDGSILKNTTTNCTYNLLNATGQNILIFSTTDKTIKFGGLGVNACTNCFNLQIVGANFSKEGTYSYQIRCQTNPPAPVGGYLSDNYEVTPIGNPEPEGIIIVFFSIIFLIIMGFMLYILVLSIGHFASLDLDVIDLAKNLGIYFALLGYYLIEITYLSNPNIEGWLLILIKIGGFTQVLIPLIGFLISITVGSLRKKQIDFGTRRILRRQKIGN